VSATLSLGDGALRARYVGSVAATWPIDDLARALDVICERAEQAEASPREVLVAIVDALNASDAGDLVQRLREQAAGESLLALERLVRHPAGPTSSMPPEGRVPDASAPPLALGGERAGRPLTLGERKWLARRPDRETIQRLLADPHPEVIARCLRNPRLTEDDVVRLAAKRPGRGDILAEIARSRWAHRPRVRVALVMNPASPLELAARVAGLLLRPELQLVARSPGVSPGLRALCLEHLERRPPTSGPGADDRGGIH